METPEDATVVHAVGGDRDALEALLREHGPSVAAGLSVDPRWRTSFDRDDVMQVTYLEACLRIATLNARTPAGFRAWLARIAENNLRDAVRELQRDKRPDERNRVRAVSANTSAETLLATLLGDEPTAGTLAAGSEAVAHLRQALARLPESYRRVVEEVDLEERAAADVAAEMQRSPGAVHMLRSRAHDRLRELLGGRRRFFGDSA